MLYYSLQTLAQNNAWKKIYDHEATISQVRHLCLIPIRITSNRFWEEFLHCVKLRYGKLTKASLNLYPYEVFMDF